MEICRAGRTSTAGGRKHLSRNFHQILKKTDRVLPVHVKMVKVRVKVHRPRVEELDMDYPFIGLESWCEYILEHCSHHLLGGFEIGKDAAQYTAMFHRFWERYKQLDPSHIAFSTFSDFGRVIPYCVHGDEGRGKAKSAILITSYQALISPHGEGATNLKG